MAETDQKITELERERDEALEILRELIDREREAVEDIAIMARERDEARYVAKWLLDRASGETREYLRSREYPWIAEKKD